MRMDRKQLLSFFFIFFCCITSIFASYDIPFSQRPDVHVFIKKMVTEYDFNEQNLDNIFNQVKLQPAILDIMEKPAETWTWGKYQKFLITPARIQAGIDFWNQHSKTLAAIEKKDGVPASVIVAIIGVETFYGKIQGNYRVLDALATLSFEYPKRKAFFQNELKDYLLLARENQLDVFNMLGSYAGAIGPGQFMPSSYRIYAIDYSQRGVADLRNDTNDVIASIGNFLSKHGWCRGEVIATKAHIKGTRYEKLKTNQLTPTYTLLQLKINGVTPRYKRNYSKNARANLMILEDNDADMEYWLGFHNFYVISRYNPRINYTMAVYQLAEAIKHARTLNKH